MRYFLEISYKGTNFHGWQKQPNAISVQEEIQKALLVLFNKNIDITGAGRTDAGVHAKQLFAHFDMDKELKTKDAVYRINALLPNTVVVKNIFPVLPNAHARFDAFSRSYEYYISLVKDPFNLDITWQVTNKNFDINAMNKASELLLKHHNFKAFSKSKTDVKTFDCTISEAYWTSTNGLLVFHITANRFLRNMVRAIVGTLLDVGTKKINISDFETIILSQNRSEAGLSVPAKGLFLTKIIYPETLFIL